MMVRCTCRIACSILLVLALAGCQDVFTWTPFGFIETKPADLPTDKLIEYSWDVMASDDTAKITDALAAVTARLADELTNGKLAYVGANLAAYLSNATSLFVSPPPDTSDPVALATYADAYKLAIDVPSLEAAAAFYTVALTQGIELNATDYYLACIGGLLNANGSSFDALEGLDSTALGVPYQSYFDEAGVLLGATFGPIWASVVDFVFFTVLP